jgi:hypothetical protein
MERASLVELVEEWWRRGQPSKLTTQRGLRKGGAVTVFLRLDILETLAAT